VNISGGKRGGRLGPLLGNSHLVFVLFW